MQSTDIPNRFPIPFANGAGAGFIRDIPTAASTTPGVASLTEGFPPECFQPIGAGGVPPAGEDMNGVLFRVTGWARWQAAGGPVTFNSAFSTSIGGYPKGAFLQSAVTPGLFFVSTVENNVVNPDADLTGWQALIPARASDAEVAAGTVDDKYVSPLKLANLRANAAEVLAGLDAVKYISPAVLKAVFGYEVGESYIIFPGGLKLCWGRFRGLISGERRLSVGLPITFDAPPIFQVANIWNDVPGREDAIDMWMQTQPQFNTTTSVAFYAAASSGGNSARGFDWIAGGV
jgi:hypothetical protein